MSILPQKSLNVKEIQSGGLAPDGEGRAMLESNLSAPSGPSGASLSGQSPDGEKAINSPTDSLSPKTAPDTELSHFSGSSPVSVGLSLIYVNCDTFLDALLAAFREYCSKLENVPCTFLHLENKQDGSTALYRVNACSCSRYFQQGRAQMIKNIHQRLDGESKRGVFFTLTVDAKRYSLTDAWPSMWPEFKRFKDALNIYRKRNMNARHGIRYLAALEPHESDYPHLHTYCPELRWLIKKQDLSKMDEWWRMGSVKTEKEREDSARGYIVKYISKLDGWSEVSMAMIWHFRIRVYNLSHQYYVGESQSEWQLLGRYKDAEGLSEGLGIGFKRAEALLHTLWEVEDNLVYLKPP